ncbi:hypothetical protein OHT68_43650 [Streptomyces canus]|uniref:hypothetical protein n=1 Tax=Streptomyces canus TaxID=58343 RepID=UPI002E2B3650|nr:hypothetical protein [Streptomyces canus]
MIAQILDADRTLSLDQLEDLPTPAAAVTAAARLGSSDDGLLIENLCGNGDNVTPGNEIAT